MLAVYSPLAFVFLFLLAPPDAGLLPDDVSKVTLPAWPGQGMDAIVIFRTLSPFGSCPYSDTILLPAVIASLHCIYLDLGSLESLL